jgi:hypothetical protein
MSEQDRHLLAEVRAATRDYRQAQREATSILNRAAKPRRRAIKAALRGGISARRAAQAADISKQRIHQIAKERG